jgi:hypothetical protein
MPFRNSDLIVVVNLSFFDVDGNIINQNNEHKHNQDNCFVVARDQAIIILWLIHWLLPLAGAAGGARRGPARGRQAGSAAG